MKEAGAALFVVATAGHVDHGKSTLVEALTGTHPDRLAEEKARGMTIDLGFAWMTLPSGREIGMVDVPGHQRFIHNMLAGVGSINAVLFVVDAVEGWMPQSAEHLAIIDLLGVHSGVVAVTKADLAEPDWVALVMEDVRERLQGTTLRDAPILPVSSVTRQGLDELVRELDGQLDRLGPAPDWDRPRLWVDRAFSIRGAGTVVTGTLTGGSLAVDQEVEVLPASAAARVRGLQTHRRPVTRASPASRVAVNLTGVDPDLVARGSAVVRPGQWRLVRSPVAVLRVIREAPAPLRTGARLTLYTGTAEARVTLRLLTADALRPGEGGLAQLLLQEGPGLPLQWRDRLILRDPGRQVTPAGGEVVDPLAEPLEGSRLVRRLSAPERQAAAVFLGSRRPCADPALLWRKAAGDVEGAVAATLEARGALRVGDLAYHVAAAAEELQTAVRAIEARGDAVRLGDWLLSAPAAERLQQALATLVRGYHQSHPLASEMPRETARSSLGVDARLFEEALARLVSTGLIEAGDRGIRLAGHRPRFSERDLQEADRLVRLLETSGFMPPSYEELVGQGFREDLLAALAEQGRLVRVSREFFFTPAQLERVRAAVAELAAQTGTVDPAAVRDALGSSRRYVIPLLEYLDRTGFTRRVGDRRVVQEPGAPRPLPHHPADPAGSTADG